MQTPWMPITGCSIFGFLLPEALLAFGNVQRVPVGMNLASMLGAALVAASFVA